MISRYYCLENMTEIAKLIVKFSTNSCKYVKLIPVYSMDTEHATMNLCMSVKY